MKKQSKLKTVVRGILWMLFLAAIIAGVLLWRSRKNGDESKRAGTREKQIPVVLMPLKKVGFEQAIAVSGNVESKEFALVSARIPGVLDAIYVDEGDRVEAGKTKLFQTDAVKLQKAVQIAERKCAVAECTVREKQANRERVQADFHKVELDYERYKRLFTEDHAVTKNVFELQESKYLQLKAALKHAQVLVELSKEELERARADLAIAQKDLKDSLVFPPLDGTVSHRFKEPGEMASAGMPVVRIDTPSPLEVSCFIPASYYAQVQSGQTVMRITVNDTRLTEKVVYRSPTVDAKLRNFEVRCLIEKPPADVVAGTMAQIDILLQQRDALGVPDGAVEMRKGRPVIFTVENKKAKMVPVTTGLKSEGMVEIASDAVKENMAVVVMGQFMLEDGTPVGIQEQNNGNGGK